MARALWQPVGIDRAPEPSNYQPRAVVHKVQVQYALRTRFSDSKVIFPFWIPTHFQSEIVSANRTGD